VVVFNAQEIKDWQPPSSQPLQKAHWTGPSHLSQMCYAGRCPHADCVLLSTSKREAWIPVIFTIKDHQDRLIAQEITHSIMITDDHKTHNLPTLPTRASIGSDVYSPALEFTPWMALTICQASWRRILRPRLLAWTCRACRILTSNFRALRILYLASLAGDFHDCHASQHVQADFTVYWPNS